MRILVCGGRNFNDYNKLKEVLDCYDISAIIEGEARGADRNARVYGESKGIPVRKFPADWDTYGRAAGQIRNKQMLDEGKPDMVIAFPGGKGTANMVKQAKDRGVKVYEVT